MKRLIPLLLAIPMLLLAFVLGAANAEPVTVDLIVVAVHWPLGVVLMLTLGLGMLLMALVLYFFQILPLNLRLRACQRKAGQGGDTHEIQQA